MIKHFTAHNVTKVSKNYEHYGFTSRFITQIILNIVKFARKDFERNGR